MADLPVASGYCRSEPPIGEAALSTLPPSDAGLAGQHGASQRLRLVVEILEEMLGRRVSPEMIWRWRSRGIRLPDGSVVKLRCRRCGRRWFTTEAAVQEFIERQTVAHSPYVQDEPSVPDLDRRLKAAGLA